MNDLLLHSIAKRFRGEFNPSNIRFTLGGLTAGTLSVGINQGFFAYILKYGGYANNSNVQVEFQTKEGVFFESFVNWPDTFFEDYWMPITEYAFDARIDVVFTNNGVTDAEVDFKIALLLIPMDKKLEFENAILKLSE